MRFFQLFGMQTKTVYTLRKGYKLPQDYTNQVDFIWSFPTLLFTFIYLLHVKKFNKNVFQENRCLWKDMKNSNYQIIIVNHLRLTYIYVTHRIVCTNLFEIIHKNLII